MEILRGMEVKIAGVIHRLIFLKKKKYYFFFFFFLGGGAYLCKLLGGGGTPPRAPPPIPTALYFTLNSHLSADHFESL